METQLIKTYNNNNNNMHELYFLFNIIKPLVNIFKYGNSLSIYYKQIKEVEGSE
jgi:hypothetical protein